MPRSRGGGWIANRSTPRLPVKSAAKVMFERDAEGKPVPLRDRDVKRTSVTLMREEGVRDAWRHSAARHREGSVQERHYAQAIVQQGRKAIDRLAVLLAKAGKGRR